MLWKNSRSLSDYSDREWHLVEGVANEPTTSVGAGNYANLNVAEPTSSSHCATKNYVDTTVSSIDFSPYFLGSGGSFSGDIKLEGNTLFLRSETPGYVYSLSYNATNGMEIQSDNLISFVESDAGTLVRSMSLNSKTFDWGGAMSSLSLSAPTIFTSIINPYASEVLIDARLDMNSNRIENVGDATSGGDAISRTYGDGRYLLKSGDNMTGNLKLNGNELWNCTRIGGQLGIQLDANG